MEYLNLFIAASLGILGYALIIKSSVRSWLPTLVLGLIGTAVYVVADNAGSSSFVSNLLAALILSLGARICARVFKAPNSVFLFPAVIVLVPGSYLYFTMSHLLAGEYALGWENAMETIKISAGIADGLICGVIIVSTIEAASKALQKKRNSNRNI